MFSAIINYGYNFVVTLGPTDSRDEASRLARAWIEAHAAAHARDPRPPNGYAVFDVEIERC